MIIPLDCKSYQNTLRAENTISNAAYHPRGRLKVQRGPRVPPRPPQIVIRGDSVEMRRDTRRRLLFFFLLPRSATVYPPSSITCTYIHTRGRLLPTGTTPCARVGARDGRSISMNSDRAPSFLFVVFVVWHAHTVTYIHIVPSTHTHRWFLPLVDDITGNQPTNPLSLSLSLSPLP
jgi:hypothetical protein